MLRDLWGSRLSRRVSFAFALAMCGAGAGCGGRGAASADAARPAPQTVFEMAAPSVVAVLNDDAALRDEDAKRAMKELGVQPHAPKTVIDVSLRKTPMPHGTGFLVDGGLIVTAAHVIQNPDRLKVTARDGQTVDCELAHIDEVRDIALLKPKAPLASVRPIPIFEGDIPTGRKVWALGHTGSGLWALAWGISEGIASGNIDLLGSQLLLFDAPVYPGFSGGPVVTFGADGKLQVVGVNHAILVAGNVAAATISSAASVASLRAALAKQPSPIERVLADYAKENALKPRGEIFITRKVSVHTDSQMRKTAMIAGNEKTLPAEELTHVPVVAMLFGYFHHEKDVDFEIRDPSDKLVASMKRPLSVRDKERVAFIGADIPLLPKVGGRYEVLAKLDDKEIARTDVWLELASDDDQPIEDEDLDDAEEGQPRVDIVVASGGNEDPLMLSGIRSAWSEYHYPRRVNFTWFARGSRGWSGTNVAISAFVLDDRGKIVGHGVGCIRPELRPEQSWSCVGQGGLPLVSKTGPHDVVFTLNDRPVAVWPMEAMLREGGGQGGPLDRWLQELRKPSPVKKPAPKP